MAVDHKILETILNMESGGEYRYTKTHPKQK